MLTTVPQLVSAWEADSPTEIYWEDCPAHLTVNAQSWLRTRTDERFSQMGCALAAHLSAQDAAYGPTVTTVHDRATIARATASAERHAARMLVPDLAIINNLLGGHWTLEALAERWGTDLEWTDTRFVRFLNEQPDYYQIATDRRVSVETRAAETGKLMRARIENELDSFARSDGRCTLPLTAPSLAAAFAIAGGLRSSLGATAGWDVMVAWATRITQQARAHHPAVWHFLTTRNNESQEQMSEEWLIARRLLVPNLTVYAALMAHDDQPWLRTYHQTDVGFWQMRTRLLLRLYSELTVPASTPRSPTPRAGPRARLMRHTPPVQRPA